MSITQDIRAAFQQRDNALTKLLLINGAVFAVLIILKAIFFISQKNEVFLLIMRQLELSANASVLMRHPWTVLTYAFVHSLNDPFHIVFNMLNLYWFGQVIREYLGNRRLVSLYILGALVGATFFWLSLNSLPVFQRLAENGQTVVGASAAVTAIIVAAATLLPDYTFMVILLGPVKIKWIALVVVLISVAGLSGGNAGGQLAHLGGALLGFIFIKQMQAGRDMGRPVQAIGRWLTRLTTRRPALEVSYRTGGSGARGGSALAAPKAKVATGTAPEEVDMILDKISRSGYESLSKDEKQKLFRASQQ